MGPDAMTGALLRGGLDTDTGEVMLPCAYRTREAGPPGTAAGQSHDSPWLSLAASARAPPCRPQLEFSLLVSITDREKLPVVLRPAVWANVL